MLRNRRLWLGSLIVSLAALVLGTPAGAADLTKYLPNETEFVLTLNVQQLLDSPLVKKEGLPKIKAELQKEKTKKILDALGFDPLKDLTNFTVAGPVSADFEKKLGIITGKFDVDKFQKLAEEHAKNSADNLKITKEGKYKVWEVTGHEIPNFPETVYITMVDNTTVLLAGGKPYLKEALAKADGKKKTELKKEIGGLVEKVDDKQTGSLMVDAAAVANADFIPNIEQAAKALEQFKTFTFGVTLTKEVSIKIDLGAKSAMAARKMSKEINKGLILAPALIGVAAMQQEQLAPFVDVIKDIINGTKVIAKGESVLIRTVITQELMEKMEKAAKKAKGGDD
jgi:hypothetical protein